MSFAIRKRTSKSVVVREMCSRWKRDQERYTLPMARTQMCINGLVVIKINSVDGKE